MGHYDDDYEAEEQRQRKYDFECRHYLMESPTWKAWRAKADQLLATKVGALTLSQLLAAMDHLKAEPKTVSPTDQKFLTKLGIHRPKLTSVG